MASCALRPGRVTVAVLAEGGDREAVAALAAAPAGSTDPSPSGCRARARHLPASGSSPVAPAYGRYVPARICPRMFGHAVRSSAAVSSTDMAVDPGRAFVGLHPFPGFLQVQRAPGPRPAGQSPVLSGTGRGQVASSLLRSRRSFTAPCLEPPRSHGHLTPCFPHGPYLQTLLFVRSLASSPRLLRPLLTSHSGSTPSPFFRRKARSPRVRTHSFTALPPDSRRIPLVTRASRFTARSPWEAPPHIRFLSIGTRFTLHASSPRSVALTQLRFTSLAMTSLGRDFHPAGVRPCRAHSNDEAPGFPIRGFCWRCDERADGFQPA